MIIFQWVFVVIHCLAGLVYLSKLFKSEKIGEAMENLFYLASMIAWTGFFVHYYWK